MIEVSRLKKVFDHRGIAGLHDLSLSVKAGEIFSILGPNGSGKSTLLKMISTETTPEEGQVRLGGSVKSFRPLPPSQDLNVQRYLISKVTNEIDEEKKIQLARDLADIFEFTFQLRQNFSQLSSGQAQKVMVAAELMDRADILLLDEPFAHLDPHTREDILLMLFKYLRQQQTTVLWVTHDLLEAFRFSDRAGVMNFGRWEQIGTPTTLLSAPRNLFVAKFLGHKNLVAVKHNGNAWTTPWGELPGEGKSGADALLILTENWEVSSTGLPMTILERIPSHHSELLILESERGTFWARFRRGVIPEKLTTVTLRPDLSYTTVIPL